MKLRYRRIGGATVKLWKLSLLSCVCVMCYWVGSSCGSPMRECRLPRPVPHSPAQQLQTHACGFLYGVSPSHFSLLFFYCNTHLYVVHHLEDMFLALWDLIIIVWHIQTYRHTYTHRIHPQQPPKQSNCLVTKQTFHLILAILFFKISIS